jgi:hypothetical protein
MIVFPPRRISVPKAFALGCLVFAVSHAACTDGTGPSQPTDTPAMAALTPSPTARPANKPPTVSIDFADPSTAILRVTSVTFVAAASDPEGDALDYVWDFGDGETVQTTNGVIGHAFDKPGTFDVTLSVADKRGGTATARRTVNVVRMSGTWFGLLSNGPNHGLRLGGEVAQTGRAFQTNMILNSGDGTGPSRGVSVSGILFDPRDMSFTIAGLCGADVTYRGSWNDKLDAYTGDGAGCGLDYHHIELYR